MKGGWCSRYHIDMKIKEDGFEWQSMGIYGESKTDEKQETWKLLCTLSNHSDNPWLMVGDFNEILLRKVPSTQHFCPMYLTNPHQQQQTDGENHCNILRKQLSSINTILTTKCRKSSQHVAHAYAAKPTQACQTIPCNIKTSRWPTLYKFWAPTPGDRRSPARVGSGNLGPFPTTQYVPVLVAVNLCFRALAQTPWSTLATLASANLWFRYNPISK